MLEVSVSSPNWDAVRVDSAENSLLCIHVQGKGHERYEFRLIMVDKQTGYTAELQQWEKVRHR